ncbi:molecular chaperone DnaJ [Bacillus wiedmannii]|uniref:J domain-containing protein n=1 Tax=Bacillus wiedmannii TaxID=1890302 RepID=UPI000BEFCC68|nr:tetratricopeptide repeat protein [Bacillus wiedmannii]PEN00308.1 molecular chaperone DnaJ [Bacillus wiedmannii]
MNNLTYYELLEIEQSASQDEIKKAYFRKIRMYSNEKYPEEFKQLTKAYEELMNEEQRAVYDRSIQNGGEYDSLLNQALNYKNGSEYQEAITILNDLLINYSDSPDVRYHLADCYYELGWFTDAKTAIQELIFDYPSVIEYHFLLFLIYRDQQEYSKAIAQANKLIKLQPQSPYPYRHLSDVYINIEEYDNAIKALERRLSNCTPGLEDMPLLIDLLYLTNGQGRREYCVRVGERIKRVPQNDEEKQAVINMLLNQTDEIDITHSCLPRIVRIIQDINQNENMEISNYLRDLEHQMESNNYSEMDNRDYSSQSNYNNEVATNVAPENNTNYNVSYASRGNIVVAIIVGIIFSFIGTPVVGIIAGFIYYFFAEAIWNMIGCLVAIIIVIVIAGAIFS